MDIFLWLLLVASFLPFGNGLAVIYHTLFQISFAILALLANIP
jgi:hypothetical protein